MIKFFRKIRQNLLMENKTGRYFKYAIGEIVLVVIGILIALQINNWNEQNKIDSEEKILIAGLIQNIDEDIKNLESVQQSDSIFIVANKMILTAFKDDTLKNNTAQLSFYGYSGSFTPRFNPTQTVFNQMEFSGKLNYISKDSILNKIQLYYDEVEKSMKIQENITRLIGELGIMLINFIDLNSAYQILLPEYARFEFDEFDNSFFYEPLSSNKVKEFANITTARQVIMVPLLNSHKSLLQSALQLKQDLKTYLNQK